MISLNGGKQLFLTKIEQDENVGFIFQKIIALIIGSHNFMIPEKVSYIKALDIWMVICIGNKMDC